MKKYQISLIIFLVAFHSHAQVIPVNPVSTGYFFHPSSPRALNLAPSLTLVSPNTYETQVADLSGLSFRFSVDALNHLTNWIPLGTTPSGSGFMTADNPGNFTYPVSPGPGTAPYTQGLYNNTYDLATHTFYLHYGYTASSGGTAILQEHFDAGVPATWAQTNKSSPIGPDPLWKAGDPANYYNITAYDGTANAYVASSYNAAASGGANTISNWLFTPVMNVKNGDVLTFWSRIPTLAQSGGVEYPDRLEVRMSTNGTSTNVGSTATSVGDFPNLLLTINPALTTGVYPMAWTQFTAVVSGLPSGISSGRVAFRMYDTDNGSGVNEDYIALDNVAYTSTGSFTQNSYERQVYEKLVFTPTPQVSSATPLTGNILTPVTITGHGFEQGDGVAFGNTFSDSTVVVSDSSIVAWPGLGASGGITVSNNYAAGTPLPGFIYNPINVTADTVWQPVGVPGFSANPVTAVTIAADHANNPYVAFEDTTVKKVQVMKYDGTNWISIGSNVSDVTGDSTRILFDHQDHPIVAYKNRLTHQLVLKKYDGANWLDLALPTVHGDFSMAIDRNNNIYVAENAITPVTFQTQINVFRYDGATWNTSSNIVANDNVNGIDLAVDTLTNIPYIIYSEPNIQQAHVIKLSGAVWTAVGAVPFSSLYGIFYPKIMIDNHSNPIALFQEDNGYERLSAYKFSGSQWVALGNNHFSKAHSFWPSVALDNSNDPFVLFQDATYNKQWTVRRYNSSTGGNWDTVGRRGEISGYMYMNALTISNSSDVFIALTDTAHGSKATVLKLKNKCFINTNTWTGATDNLWEHAGNWSCGIVPQLVTNVVLPAGSVVVLGSNTSIHSLTLQPGANLSISPGSILTITLP